MSSVVRSREHLNLKQFEGSSEAMDKSFRLALRELELTLGGERSITDRTKLAAVTVGAFAKLKGAEVHRMAVEIMVRKKINLQIPEKV